MNHGSPRLDTLLLLFLLGFHGFLKSLSWPVLPWRQTLPARQEEGLPRVKWQIEEAQSEGLEERSPRDMTVLTGPLCPS